MKKYLLVIICLSFFTCGCGKEENNTASSFTNDRYAVFSPYKDPVAFNYITSYIPNTYDIKNVENSLMDLSSKYFNPSNTYYQAGQYLKKENIIELIEMVNDKGVVEIDGINIDTKYVSYFHEQNYLTGNGLLKGLSLAIVLNPYQSYQNSSGANLSKKIDDQELIDDIKVKIPMILEYIRSKLDINDVRIIIGLYIMAGPNDILPGHYTHLGITSNNKISLEEVNYQYYLLDGLTLMDRNNSIYNAFLSFKKDINQEFSDLYISGDGLLLANNLTTANITINTSYLSKDKLLYLSALIKNSLDSNFNIKANINVYLKFNGEITAWIVKDKQSESVQINLTY